MNYEKVTECPICRNTTFSNKSIITDFANTGESFALTSCTKCQFLITNPRPIKDEIDRYYDFKEYVSHNLNPYNPISLIYALIREWSLSYKTDIIRKIKPKGSLLDYGCGTGSFVYYTAKKGYDSMGIEPNVKARKHAEKINKGKIHESYISIEPSKKFDIITSWHVLEHIHDLNETIIEMKKKLSDDGVMIHAMPNIKSYDASYYKEHWAAWDVPRHLSHFTQQNVKQLFAKHKLTVKSIYPLYFDSFYVSIMSEKYKNQKNNYWNALKIGMKSNREAKKNSEYSSLIYLIQK